MPVPMAHPLDIPGVYAIAGNGEMHVPFLRGLVNTGRYDCTAYVYRHEGGGRAGRRGVQVCEFTLMAGEKRIPPMDWLPPEEPLIIIVRGFRTTPPAQVPNHDPVEAAIAMARLTEEREARVAQIAAAAAPEDRARLAENPPRALLCPQCRVNPYVARHPEGWCLSCLSQLLATS